MTCSTPFSQRLSVGSTHCFTRPILFWEREYVYGVYRSVRLNYKNVYVLVVFAAVYRSLRLNCRNVYVLVVFRRSLSVGYNNYYELFYSLLPASIRRFDKLFYPAFCVFRTRNVHVLLVFRRPLSVGSTNCSSYSIPFCFFRTRKLNL